MSCAAAHVAGPSNRIDDDDDGADGDSNPPYTSVYGSNNKLMCGCASVQLMCVYVFSVMLCVPVRAPSRCGKCALKCKIEQ